MAFQRTASMASEQVIQTLCQAAAPQKPDIKQVVARTARLLHGLQSAFKICNRPIVVRRTKIEQARPKKYLGKTVCGRHRATAKESCGHGDLNCDELPRSPWHIDCIA